MSFEALVMAQEVDIQKEKIIMWKPEVLLFKVPFFLGIINFCNIHPSLPNAFCLQNIKQYRKMDLFIIFDMLK